MPPRSVPDSTKELANVRDIGEHPDYRFHPKCQVMTSDDVEAALSLRSSLGVAFLAAAISMASKVREALRIKRRRSGHENARSRLRIVVNNGPLKAPIQNYPNEQNHEPDLPPAS